MMTLYCPGCEVAPVDPVVVVRLYRTDVDALPEATVRVHADVHADVRWCAQHEPSRAGVDDAKVAYGYVPQHEGGEDGARWCDLLHRGRR